MNQKIVPSLWFDTEAVEAAEFYVSVFDLDNANRFDSCPRRLPERRAQRGEGP